MPPFLYSHLVCKWNQLGRNKLEHQCLSDSTQCAMISVRYKYGVVFFLFVKLLCKNCCGTKIFDVQPSADTSKDLASELVHYAFINEVNLKQKSLLFISDHFRSSAVETSSVLGQKRTNWRCCFFLFSLQDDSEKVAGFLEDAISRHRVRSLASGGTQWGGLTTLTRPEGACWWTQG